jgi:thiamine biosynthesis lipoprotein
MTIKVDDKALVVSKEFYALGTSNLLTAYGENAEAAIYEAMRKLLDIDNKMSVFKNTSEFSKINSNAGEAPIAVSADTYYVIERAVQYSQISKGAFDPTIRPVVDLWGIGKDNENIPPEEAIKEKLKLVNYKSIILNEKANSIKLANKDQLMDGGAIAKGFAADAVRDIFVEHNIKSAIIDLGGNIFVIGNNPKGMPWRVGLQNPLDQRGEFVGILNISDKSVVTSGDYERFFIKDNKKFHHIIDPRTGYPSNNGVISATIVSDCSIDGDALSTCVYVMGVKEGLKLIEAIEGVDVIFITEDKRIHISSGIKDNFTLTNSIFRIET